MIVNNLKNIVGSEMIVSFISDLVGDRFWGGTTESSKMEEEEEMKNKETQEEETRKGGEGRRGDVSEGGG